MLPSPRQEAIMGLLPQKAGAISDFYLVALSKCVQVGWVDCENGTYRITEAGAVARKQGLKEPIR